MAIANSDGSIILSTKVDTSGIHKGMSQMQGKASSLTKIFSALGAAIASAFAIQKIIQFSNESANLATQTEASVQRLVDIYGEANGAVGDFIDQNARALGMSKAAAASFSSVYGNLFSVWADQSTNAELTNRYLNMTAVVASKTGRTVEDVQERIRSGLLGNTEAIEDLGIFVNVKTIEMTDAFQRMADGKSWEQLDAYTQQQIRSMAILEQATAKYGDEVADTSATMRNRYKAAYEDFQNSWGNIVNTVLLPVLEMLTQIFDIATKGLNALSGRSGQILENVELQEENTAKTAKNIEEQTKNQKELNKELKKSLAGFDEIQVLSANTAENASGVELDSGLQGVGGDLGGNTPDGSVFEETSQKIQDLAKVVAKAMIVIGCVLLATGNIGWGIGLIIAGAMAEGIVEASVGDGSSFQEIANKISNAIIIAGVVAIIIGILLCMAQMWGLGIGLIIKGAVAVAGPVALNWNGIKEQLQGSFGGWLVLGGVIAIVLGILLCFTHALPLGIGLIVLGAAAVVAPIVANWDAIWDAITGTFNVIIDWIKTYGLLVLGILLCLTGGLPFGFALILKWAKDNAEEIPLANKILEFVASVWSSVKGFWNRYIAPVFTWKWWANLAIDAGNGLIRGFEFIVNGIITMFENMINFVVNGINSIGFDIPDWLGGGRFGFNIPKVQFGRISIPKIPRLAQGSVIPGGREFMAILGDQPRGQTNIEAPLDTIVEAFNIALSQHGNSNGFNGRIEVPVIINGREIARAVRESEQDMGKQTVFGGFANAY